MLKETLLELFERDLLKLKEEINLYASEDELWTLKPGIGNSAGTLCLHLVGNLNHFIGAALGKTGYIRDRDSEFSLRNVPREDLIADIDDTRIIVSTVLERLSDADLAQDFPLEKHGKIVATEHMLVHLLAHLGYHLGQVNYHRRLTLA